MLQPRGAKTARPLRRAELVPLADRFERRVHPEPNTGCYWWDGATTKLGYGQIRQDGRVHLAHRVAYVLAHGDLELGADVLHSCDNPLCCSPAHLRVGDQHANNDDIDARDRRRKGERHPRFGQGVMAKITAEQAAEIRLRHAAGERTCDLARAFSLTWKQVHRIRTGQSWGPTPVAWFVQPQGAAP